MWSASVCASNDVLLALSHRHTIVLTVTAVQRLLISLNNCSDDEQHSFPLQKLTFFKLRGIGLSRTKYCQAFCSLTDEFY